MARRGFRRWEVSSRLFLVASELAAAERDSDQEKENARRS
jgi:hypothetical protein